MASTNTAAPMTRSWAQVVHGDSENTDSKEQKIKPATRGSLLRFCRGKVLTMLSHYGWLMVCGDVDHPSTEKHGGDVYIHKDDIVDGVTLCAGDIVSFYLYVDDQGLGAEMCRVEEKATSSLNPNALEFVPSSMQTSSPENSIKHGRFHFTKVVDAHPTSPIEDVAAKAVVLGDVRIGWESEPVVVDEVADDMFMRLANVFSSDDEDSEDEAEYEPAKACKTQRARAASSDGSTCGDATSDSEDDLADTSSGEASDSESLSDRLPPGMTMPLHFRPPPGLEAVLAF